MGSASGLTPNILGKDLQELHEKTIHSSEEALGVESIEELDPFFKEEEDELPPPPPDVPEREEEEEERKQSIIRRLQKEIFRGPGRKATIGTSAEGIRGRTPVRRKTLTGA